MFNAKETYVLVCVYLQVLCILNGCVKIGSLESLTKATYIFIKSLSTKNFYFYYK